LERRSILRGAGAASLEREPTLGLERAGMVRLRWVQHLMAEL
jgi:hypothetical protein